MFFADIDKIKEKMLAEINMVLYLYWRCFILENKLSITNLVELAKGEERITKIKVLELFDTNKINEGYSTYKMEELTNI